MKIYDDQEKAWLLVDEIVIRKAVISDSKEIKPLFIELQNIHATSLPKMFHKIDEIELKAVEFEINSYPYFYVATFEDKIIGYMKGSFKKLENSNILLERKMISLIDLIIDKKYRNQGIGKKMLSFLEEKAKEQGLMSIEIPVYAFNEDAGRFYEENGYHKYVERKVKNIES